MKATIALAILIALAAPLALAQTERPKLNVSEICDLAPAKKPEWSDPVLCLVEATKLVYSLCQLTAKLTSDYGCVDEGIASSAKIYGKANTATAKKKATNERVKDYYASWRAAMASIRPESGEVAISYSRRQADTANALNAKGERLKLE